MEGTNSLRDRFKDPAYLAELKKAIDTPTSEYIPLWGTAGEIDDNWLFSDGPEK